MFASVQIRRAWKQPFGIIRKELPAISATRPRLHIKARSTSAKSAPPPSSVCSRRDLVFAGCAAASLALVPDARSFPLAPLGQAERVGGPKKTGLTPEQIAAQVERDLSVGMYFVTGDLTQEVFADDCRFIDPTNDVTGLSRYKKALGLLFDPAVSKVVSLGVRVTGPRTVEADWVLGGYLKFPWNPKVEPFKGHTVYTLNDKGLIQIQDQSWSISAAEALQETFTPTFETPKQLM